MSATRCADKMDNQFHVPLMEFDSAAPGVEITVSEKSEVNAVHRRRSMRRRILIAVVAVVLLAIGATVALVVTLGFGPRSSTPTTPSAASATNSVYSPEQNQATITTGSNYPSMVAVSNVFQQNVVVSGASLTHSTQSVSSLLSSLCPTLGSSSTQAMEHATMVKTEGTSMEVSVMRGVCAEIAGLTGAQCTVMVYNDQHGDVQCVLVITLNSALNLANIPVLQNTPLSFITDCLQLSATGSIVVSSAAVSDLSLVPGINVALTLSSTGSCPFASFMNQYGVSLSSSPLNALITIPSAGSYSTGTVQLDLQSLSMSISADGDAISLAINNLQITAQSLGSNDPVFSWQGGAALTLPNSPPLSFTVQGEYSQNQLSVQGNCPGWNAPFGLSAVSFGATQVSINASSETYSVTFSSSIDITTTGQPQASFQVAGYANNQGALFQATGQATAVASLACALADISPCSASVESGFANFGISDPSISFLVATSTGLPIPLGGGVVGMAGLNITAQTSIVNPLLGEVQSIFSSFPVSNSEELFVLVPIFSPQNIRSDFELGLTVQGFPISSQVTSTGMSLSVFPLQPDITASTAVLVTLSSQPNSPLEFQVTGSLTATQIQLTGQMVGTWQNALGIQGFDISDSELQLDFGAGFGIGIGTTITLGSETIYLDFDIDEATMQLCTYVNIPQLTLGDIASFYDDISGSQFTLPSVISGWGLEQLVVTFSDFNGEFNNIQCVAGFSVDATVSLLGITAIIDVSTTLDPLDFTLSFELDTGSLESDILNAAGVPGWVEDLVEDVFDLRYIALDDLSLSGLEQGDSPTVCIDATVIGFTVNSCLNMDLGDLLSGNPYQALKNSGFFNDCCVTAPLFGWRWCF